MSGFAGGLGYASDPLFMPNRRFSKVYTYDVLTPPAELPVSLALVKEHLRLDSADTSQDAYLTLLINASRQFFEKFTNRILINTQFRTFFDCFQQSFELARSRLVTLDAYEYLVDGTFTAVDPSIFYATFERNYSRVIIEEVDNFPTDKDDRFQSIRIDLTSGFGAADTDIPSDIQIGLLNQIASLYENRGDCGACDCSDISNLPVATQNVYRQYRIETVYGQPYRG